MHAVFPDRSITPDVFYLEKANVGWEVHLEGLGKWEANGEVRSISAEITMVIRPPAAGATQCHKVSL